MGLEERGEDLIHFRLVSLVVLCVNQISFIEQVDDLLHEIFLVFAIFFFIIIFVIVIYFLVLNKSSRWANRGNLAKLFDVKRLS